MPLGRIGQVAQECIGIGVTADKLKLLTDNAPYQLLQFLVFPDERHIGPYLGTAVA